MAHSVRPSPFFHLVLNVFSDIGPVSWIEKKKPKLRCYFFFFLKMPKIWVGGTTLNREKKEDGLNSNKIVPILWALVRSFLFFIGKLQNIVMPVIKAHVKNLLLLFTK